jgi:hypothetical protein
MLNRIVNFCFSNSALSDRQIDSESICCYVHNNHSLFCEIFQNPMNHQLYIVVLLALISISNAWLTTDGTKLRVKDHSLTVDKDLTVAGALSVTNKITATGGVSLKGSCLNADIEESVSRARDVFFSSMRFSHRVVDIDFSHPPFLTVNCDTSDTGLCQCYSQ